MIRLSILDQSAIPKGKTAKEALEFTEVLAKEAEKLGYHRFWVSEHHLETLGHSSPEVLIPHLAAHTSTIRIGSGGVMLPHYSAYKVAENFRLLEALYPNRIDLGVGRAPGGMPGATAALQEHKQRKGDLYMQQIEDLVHYLTSSKSDNHRFPGLKAMPEIDTVPEIWMLGSSGGSAGLAANHGLHYAYAQFISGEDGSKALRSYHQRFQPSSFQSKPAGLVAFFLVCAETDAQAEWLAKSMDVQFINIANGKVEGILPPEEVENYQFSPVELRHVKENRKRMLVGSPENIYQQITELSRTYGTEEFMLAGMGFDFEARLNGYRLLAEQFQL